MKWATELAWPVSIDRDVVGDGGFAWTAANFMGFDTFPSYPGFEDSLGALDVHPHSRVGCAFALTEFETVSL
jgi:hypothetical protein